LREALQRNRAEHLSYKRRMEEAETQRVAQAAARLTSSLLPVLDDLDRAAGAGPATGRVSVGSAQERVWKEGMELIREKLMAILEKEGLRKVEALGKPFNPVLHEAVAPHPSLTIPEDTIVAVQQHGYTLNGTLLRPAKVTVARRPERPRY
jgi:molecular chaperone GrpE